jgi:hypothetical protein
MQAADGAAFVARPDGKYDVAVSLATANLLKQLAEPQVRTSATR